MFRQYVGQADCCEVAPDVQHTYLPVASIVAAEGSEDGLKRFLESLGRHDWGSLRAFNQWSNQSDNVVAHVVRCPTGRGMLVAVLAPFDSHSSAYLLAKSPLDENEVRHVIQLLDRAEWLPLS